MTPTPNGDLPDPEDYRTRRVMWFTDEVDKIKPYLPANFTVLPYLEGALGGPILVRAKSVVIGTDDAGWTQDGYLLPRLASGMIYPIVTSNEVDSGTHMIDALESMYAHGFPDEQSGDVEAPTGFFYRVARWIVVADNHGMTSIFTYRNENDAKQVFAAKTHEYGDWAGDDDAA